MLKHLAVAKFKPGVTREEIDQLMKSLSTLPAIIPEIKGYDLGEDVRPERTCDFALVSVFEDAEALKRYLTHPNHAAASKYFRSLCESLQVVDFNY